MMFPLQYWILMFFVIFEASQISQAAECSPLCAKKFQNCRTFQTRKKDKTTIQAYWICRRRIDTGSLEDHDCVPRCTDSEEMSVLKSTNENSDNDLSCSQACVEEFENCHKFQNTRRRKTCNQAYNICRKQINNGFRRLADAGCIRQCQDTEVMMDLKSCGSSNGGNGGGSQATPKPSPTSLCTASCAKEFQRCHDFQNNRQGKTCIEAYNICRRQINQGFDRLANAGCIKHCKGTDDMVNLKSCDGSNGDDGDDGGNGNNPSTGARCTRGLRFSSNDRGDEYIPI